MVNIPKRRIGLTGGISTGKTTVSNYLAEVYNLPVLDADVYAREAVKASSSILTEIFARYGDRVRTVAGTLERKVLGEIIFNNQSEKQWLESKIHPYVRDRFNQDLQQLNTDTAILAIPLLFEAQMTDLVTEIWVVACSYQKQIERLKQRDRLTETQAKARSRSQFPLKEKIAKADVVLYNNFTVEELLKQVDIAINGDRQEERSFFR